MFKYDKDTKPYHMKNILFYIFMLAILVAIYYFGFLPPLLDATSGEFFNQFGIKEFIGSLFFLILIIIPLFVIYGIFYHIKGYVDPNVKAYNK